MLYPLKFKPILKEKLWGGHKLHFKSDSVLDDQKIGESWEVSGIHTNISIVDNGSLKGKSLKDLIHEFKSQLLGTAVFDKFGDEFPILIKFIEAKENLSVQLHPDDHLARKRHNSFGKTEMWYILETEKDARLITDFKHELKVDDYQHLLSKDQLESVLNSIPVQKGDAFFIKPGVVHAIGAGVLLAEIQQTSDITYRLYDWGRVDKQGNARELHTDLALEAIDFSGQNDSKIQYHPKLNTKVQLADTPYFKTDLLQLEGRLKLDYSEVDSFIILMNVGLQEASVIHEKQKFQIPSKETLLIPACIESLEVESKRTKLLEISI